MSGIIDVGKRLESMADHDSSRITHPLAHRVGPGSDAARVAHAMAAILDEINAALAPIVGQRGVAALYQRSLRKASAAHPWMGPVAADIPAVLDVTALCAALSRLAPAQALAGGEALLGSFHGLLASLVGPSLTERLLRSVWSHPPGAPSLQDNSP
jgi:hypothetical protein